MQQTFGDQPPPWPTMLLAGDKLPEELESSAARTFLIDQNHNLAGKNMTAAQLFGLIDQTLEAEPDPRVTYEYIPRGPARTNPPYDKIPAPSADDAATNATISVVAGQISRNLNAVPERLNDGQTSANEDDLKNVFVLGGGSLQGRIQVDLKESIPLSEIRSYSWHKDTRAAQVYRVFGSDGSAQNFDPTPKLGVDPTKHGWTKIATVDTRPGMKPVGPRGAAPGGRYAVSIADKDKKPLGPYRYLLFQLYVTESDDQWGHTFYGEIDVIKAN
jgi:hypothetical protein